MVMNDYQLKKDYLSQSCSSSVLMGCFIFQILHNLICLFAISDLQCCIVKSDAYFSTKFNHEGYHQIWGDLCLTSLSWVLNPLTWSYG